MGGIRAGSRTVHQAAGAGALPNGADFNGRRPPHERGFRQTASLFADEDQAH